MTAQKMKNSFVLLVALTGFVVSPFKQHAQAAETIRRGWVGEGALGFIANTPDDTAFALNLNFDRFITDHLSVGPLVQLGFTGDMAQTAVSGQGKYWFDLTSGIHPLRMALQSGIGFVNTDFRNDDTSWVIPFGAGLYYGGTDALDFGATFMLNFTDLDTGRDDSSIMPSLTFGVRY